ncbi:hypothetical protein DRJ19_03970 [Candidatus Woesearchaeota archaeon]|nr:MAG: hypothetical protein DRJ19_03970 [Candidatus Woesearchaeota archaeon]
MVKLKDIKRGYYIVHSDEPCIVKNVQSKGNSVILLVEGIFSGKQYKLNEPHDKEVDVSFKRGVAQLIELKKKHAVIIDDQTYDSYEAEFDSNMLKENDAKVGDQVIYIKYKDRVKIVDVRKELF